MTRGLVPATATDFASWRETARRLLADGVAPEDVTWGDGQQEDLFGGRDVGRRGGSPAGPARTGPTVPAAFLARAEVAADHGDPARWALLYRFLWRLTHGEPQALDDTLHPDAVRLGRLLREVREAEHDMHAFVRFRKTTDPDGAEHWIAWYRPDQPVLRRVAPFFARRYPSTRWTLLGPDASASWDGGALVFGPGTPRDEAPGPDETDALFLAYYASVFNPARTNLPAMRRHLSARTLAQMPEGAVVRSLARGAEARVSSLAPADLRSASEALLPERPSLPSLRAAAVDCRACALGELATQTVFGEGEAHAPLVVVGEQPGDEEDLAGRPFVGPAGRLLGRYLEEVGLPRERMYVTNAVKHFKFAPRGKRRLHQRPNATEVDACKGWLFAELRVVRPKMVLCLGATAAQAFAGAGFRVQRDRGKPAATPWAPWWMATFHPSALLRAHDAEREAMERAFRADLETTRAELDRLLAAG